MVRGGEGRGEAARLERVLAASPWVRKVAVLPEADGAGLAACIEVAPEAAAAVQAAPAAEGTAAEIGGWRSLWDGAYAAASEPETADLHLAGWTSSYTGMAIPAREMREWVERTVERIAALGARRVLEIGCGSGLLLLRLAPGCELYRGVDFSPHAVAYTGSQAEGAGLTQAEVLQGSAHALPPPPPGRPFDLVVLNSVAQYFPDPAYLLRVLAGALEQLAPGGRLWLGDVRSRPLLPAFHASILLEQAGDERALADLAGELHQRLAGDGELTFHPAFFPALPALLPRIRSVEIQLKRGRHRNELTRFRYDVLLHTSGGGDRDPCTWPREWLDWQGEGLSLAALRQRLEAEEPPCLGLAGVPNARLLAEVAAAELLGGGAARRPGAGLENAADLRRAANAARHREGVDPEDLWALERRLPYRFEVRWGADPADGTCDVIARHRQREGGAALRFVAVEALPAAAGGEVDREALRGLVLERP